MPAQTLRANTGLTANLPIVAWKHDKGEWLREQISDQEWHDYDWAKVEGFGKIPTYVRGFKR